MDKNPNNSSKLSSYRVSKSVCSIPLEKYEVETVVALPKY